MGRNRSESSEVTNFLKQLIAAARHLGFSSVCIALVEDTQRQSSEFELQRCAPCQEYRNSAFIRFPFTIYCLAMCFLAKISQISYGGCIWNAAVCLSPSSPLKALLEMPQTIFVFVYTHVVRVSKSKRIGELNSKCSCM